MSLINPIRQDAKTAKWLGVVLLVIGFLALLAPFATGLSLTLMIGALLLFGGVAQLLMVFRAGSFSSGLLLVLLALLSIAAGCYMVFQPVLALEALTLFLAGYFIAAGVIEVIGAFGARPHAGWGWLLFGGLVSFALGLLIWRQFPLSGAWAIGILVGVRLVMSGWTLIMIGSLVKRAASQGSQIET